MKISIFGIGYVGTVSAGCLARDGHEVLGVDPVPSNVDLIGGTDYRFVRQVCDEIGAALASKADFHVVVVRSTMLPGSTETGVIPALEAGSRKSVGEGFGVCYHPEFLREGNAVADYDDPSKIVLGTTDERSASILSSLYEHLDVPVCRTGIAAAEMVKYIDNVWHG